MVAMRCAVLLAVAYASACASSAHASYFQLLNGSVINGCCPAPGKGSADGSVVYGGNVSDCMSACDMVQSQCFNGRLMPNRSSTTHTTCVCHCGLIHPWIYNQRTHVIKDVRLIAAGERFQHPCICACAHAIAQVNTLHVTAAVPFDRAAQEVLALLSVHLEQYPLRAHLQN
jgi:hypothetical protein